MNHHAIARCQQRTKNRDTRRERVRRMIATNRVENEKPRIDTNELRKALLAVDWGLASGRNEEKLQH